MGQWYETRQPTADTAGEERRDCQICDHYESREIASPGHNFADWYTHQEATCVVVGEERRDCRDCDHYECRETGFGEHHFGDWYVFSQASCTVAGEERRGCDRCDHYESRDTELLNHSYGDWYVVLEPTIDEEGTECRDCVYCDANQMRPMPVLPSVERTYAIITYSFLNVRAGASSSAAKMGVLYEGIKVEILEQVKVGSNTWGRIEYGWICLTGYANMLTGREELVADRGDKTFATITCDYLSVRPEPDSSTARLATIQTGARVRIYEARTIGSVVWGRTAMGWIWLTGYTALDVEKGEHLEHTYGDWYVFQQGNCVTAAWERRDCQECEHYETREGQLGSHSMDVWYVIAAPTCVMPGMERQDCLFCDHYAERQIAATGQHSMGQWYVVGIPDCEKEGQQFRDCADCHYSESKPVPALGHQFDAWYVAVAPGCENPGQERRDCQSCSHYEVKDIPALGHRFGDWYVTKEATTVEMGQERRDCASCDHYETKNTERLPSTAGKMYGMFTGAGYLNIRNGAGMSYKAVGRLYPNNRVEIYEMVDVDGKTWGRIEGGWVCITGYIAVECEFVKLYATVTYSYLTIRAGAGSGTAKLGTLNQGDVVEILEIVAVGSKNWGRTAQGWICLTDHTTLTTVNQLAEDGVSIRICATITYSYLTVREGNSTSTAKLGTLKQGDVVEILEIVCVDGKEWGRTEQGWICLTGYTVLNTMN